MFTGIVEEIGRIKSVLKGHQYNRLSIECSKVMQDAKAGDSISVNGICLTVTDYGDDWFSCDVMPETMRKTGLDSLNAGSRVNLERALRLSDRLGGHIVTGHIDGTGTVVDKYREHNAVWLTVHAPGNVLKYVVAKGSVALDGTSLTVAYVDGECFKVSLIPLTAGETVLGERKAGDTVNIECDMIGKYVEKLIKGNDMQEDKKSLSIDFLRENGFA